MPLTSRARYAALALAVGALSFACGDDVPLAVPCDADAGPEAVDASGDAGRAVPAELDAGDAAVPMCTGATLCTPTDAGPFCADTRRDRLHCGGCDHACSAAAICVGGACEICSSFVQLSDPPLLTGAHQSRLLATSDLNGDGRSDFVFVDYLGAGSVQISNGDGTFRPGPLVALGSGIVAAAVLDWDGDGALDLVVDGPMSIRIARGLGMGAFAPPKTFATVAISPTTIAGGDLDGDGQAEILEGSWGSIRIVAAKNGSVSFRDLTLPGKVTGIVVADFDGDGKRDAAVGTDAGVSILPGNGDGTFGPRTDIAIGGGVSGIVAGDLDADGQIDLTVAATAWYVGVLRNAGGGTFSSVTRYDLFKSPSSVALGDVDGDGKPDVFASTFDAIFLLPNNGNGTLLPAVNVADQSMASQIATGDFDGNTKQDLIFAKNADIHVRMNRGNNSFVGARVVGKSVGQAYARDVDGDGKVDLVVSNDGMRLARGDGTGGFASPALLPELGASAGFYLPSAPADVDGDGRIDVVSFAQHDYSLAVSWNDPSGFTTTKAWVRSPVDAHVADVNGDGRPDVIVRTLGAGVSVLPNMGNRQFGTAYDVALNVPIDRIAIADLNADARPDLVISWQNQLFVALGDGAGSFGPATGWTVYDLISGYAEPSAFTLVDVDRDGDIDVAATMPLGRLAIMRNAGNGTFPVRDVLPGPAAYSMGSADVNGDGWMDLVFGAPQRLSVMLNDGTGGFGAATLYTSNAGGGGVAVIDLDQDGRPDVLTQNRDGTVVASFNKGPYCRPE